ncbi:MAG: MFS transporter [Thermoplasmata archaeon]|nr:MFS transporter [Thermoplasmata archaeon]
MDRNLRLLGIGVGIRSLGSALYFPFLALFLHSVLSVGYFEIGIIVAGVGVVQLPFSLAGGLLTDRIGRKNLILSGLGSEAVATLGLAYAFELHSLGGAIAAAIVGGSIATASGPAFSAYIADFAVGSERTRGFTWFRIGFNAGYSAGVTMGGLLVATLGFAWAVGLAAAVVGGGALLMLFALDPSPFDRALGIARAPQTRTVTGTTDPPTGSLRQSLSALARDRPAIQVAVGFALGGIFLGQWPITFPLFVHNVLGISYSLLGLGLALNGLVVVFGQSATTEAVLGRRHTTIFILGLALTAVAYLGLGVAGLFLILPTVVFFLAVAVLTFGENLVTIPLSTLPSNLAPPREVGSYNGAFQTIGGVGFLFAVIVGGWVLSLTANPFLIWAFLAAPAIPAVILLRWAARRIPIGADRA